MTCLGCGQSEVKGGPFVQLALGPDPATVPGDDALHNGKTRAIAGKFGTMQTAEDAEQLVDKSHAPHGRQLGAGGRALRPNDSLRSMATAVRPVQQIPAAVLVPARVATFQILGMISVITNEVY